MTETENEAMDEIFAEIDAEKAAREEEFKSLRLEHQSIKALLDSYGIPSSSNNRQLTLFERIDYSLKIVKGVSA